MAIKRVKAPFAIGGPDGSHRVYTAGDLVDTSDSAYKGREHLFEDLNLAVDRKAEPQTSATHASNVERATAEPEEKRSIRPWSTRADTAGAEDKPDKTDDDQDG
jgi:hypothetical protein